MIYIYKKEKQILPRVGTRNLFRHFLIKEAKKQRRTNNKVFCDVLIIKNFKFEKNCVLIHKDTSSRRILRNI